MIAGVQVLIGGTELDDALAANLTEVRIDDNLTLPDAFRIHLADPGLQAIDDDPLPLGADIEIKLAAPDGATLVSVLKGQIAAVEPEFNASGAVIVARGFDRSHSLNRTQETQTYQNMTADDIARKVASRAGLDQGQIDSAGEAYDFVQQNNETDWQFLWRLARRIDFEVVVSGSELCFRQAGSGDGDPVALTWGDNLQVFRPRVTGIQQVDEVVVRAWDPSTKDVIESKAQAGSLGVDIGVERSDVASSLGGGTVTLTDRPAMTTEEASALARSVVARIANGYVEAEGTARGNPALRAGGRIKVSGVGSRFGGTYTLSATTHIYRGGRGYETQFTVGGRSTRSLLDLMTPAAVRHWGNSLVVGVVSQNDDPDGLGRVRVTYPSLGDDTEGWWARVVAPAAGDSRGLLMMPVVGDEVVVGFEQDDVRRPYILGSVWNGKAKPGADLVHTDGSFALRSDEQIWMSAGDKITVKGEKDAEVDTEGKFTVQATGDVTIQSNGSLTIKASSIKLEADGQVKISGSGISLG
jgi:phage protein D